METLAPTQPDAPRRGRPPGKTITPVRDQRVQVALSTDERRALREQARAGGFESISDYVRTRTLHAPHPEGDEE